MQEMTQEANAIEYNYFHTACSLIKAFCVIIDILRDFFSRDEYIILNPFSPRFFARRDQYHPA